MLIWDITDLKTLIARLTKGLFGSGGAARSANDSPEPWVGEFAPDPSLEGTYAAPLHFEGRKIGFRIDPDDLTFEECLHTMRQTVAALADINTRALATASRDLLSEYNESWRFYHDKRADGTLQDCEGPKFTAAEFEAAICLTDVAVIGSMLEFTYADNGLFHGHTIFVSAWDGTTFEDAKATLFG